MKAKRNYTISGQSDPINYTPSDGKFGQKVHEARQKVDDTVDADTVVTSADRLKGALIGPIKQVVDYWDTQIGDSTKDDPSNQTANNAIEEIRGYTNPTDPARSTIGNYATPNKASHKSRSPGVALPFRDR